jgi:tRNA(Arg) A34 adenosine deaminase TadA
MSLTKNDLKFINEALNVANSSTMLMKHGCVVVEGNKIIARGWNNYRNQFHDKFIGKSCSCHAEMHALRQVIRVKTKGKSNPFRKRVGHREKWNRET